MYHFVVVNMNYEDRKEYLKETLGSEAFNGNAFSLKNTSNNRFIKLYECWK